MTQTLYPDCYSAQLHLIGRIQDYGVLLVFDSATGLLGACSDNTDKLFAQPARALLGRPWQSLLTGSVATHKLLGLMGPRELPRQRIWDEDLGGGALVVSATADGRNLLVELEPKLGALDFEDDSKLHFLKQLALSREPAEAAELLMRQVAQITGFDRVMLYQFQPGWHGKVIAENNKPGVRGYLNQCFPASDIPPNARRLYSLNFQRYLADTETPARDVLSSSDDEGVDLTWSQLRAVHPVHIEYLRNMGVRTSFSVSIMANGRLWGMVACHNRLTRSLSFKHRHLCEELARITSLHLAGLLEVGVEMRRAEMRLGLSRIESVLDGHTGTEAVANQILKVVDVLGAQSMLLRLNKKDFGRGPLQSSGRLGALRSWMRKHGGKDSWHLDKIPGELNMHPALVKHASGMLYLPFGPARQGNYVLLARNEQVEEITWAGKMPESGEAAELSPRASFEIWKQEVHGQARPWDEAELAIAGQLRRDLADYVERAKLAELALQDSLTGLGNRRSFEMALANALRHAQKTGGRFAVLLLDLDKFKPVNDSHGHAAGDELLVIIAQRLKQQLRGRDTVTRLGGDEFAIIQYHVGSEGYSEVGLVAQRLVREVNRPVPLEPATVEVGTSIGVAVYPEHGATEQALLRNADHALYAVKRSGRNNFRIYEPGMEVKP